MTLEYYKAAPNNTTYVKPSKKPKSGQLELFHKEEMGPIGPSKLKRKIDLWLIKTSK